MAAGPRPITTAFLDRDGVINRKAPEGEYVRHPGELELLPGSAEAIARLSRAGLRVVVVTNQQGVAKGLVAPDDLRAIHNRIGDAVAAAGGEIAEILVCPHRVGTCDCRKPATGLFEQARAHDPAIDFAASVVVGDAPSDMAAAAAIGARAIFVTPHPHPSPDPSAPAEVRALADAADLILEHAHA